MTLGIETSCDETSLEFIIMEYYNKPVFSQEIHNVYGM